MADEHAVDEQHDRAAVIRAAFAWQAVRRPVIGGTAVERFQHEQCRADAGRFLSRAVDELRAVGDPTERYPEPASRRNP